MRTLVLSCFMSLDGYSCDPGTELFEFFALLEQNEDPEQEEYGLARLRQAGTHIMGRVTYLGFAEYWPASTHVNAAPMNDIPKVVFSRTLRTASWPQTTIASGDTETEIAKLKAEPGGPILAHGGTSFARSLIQLGLVDEYRLCLLPAAAGKGVPLFTDFTRLRLLSTKAFPSGLLELAYAPAGTGR
jgi:dihydrofolate reductase